MAASNSISTAHSEQSCPQGIDFHHIPTTASAADVGSRPNDPLSKHQCQTLKELLVQLENNEFDQLKGCLQEQAMAHHLEDEEWMLTSGRQLLSAIYLAGDEALRRKLSRAAEEFLLERDRA